MFNPSDIVYSRRLFLTRGVQLLSVGAMVPMFLDNSATCMAADFAANPAGAGRPDDKVLVVLQMAGGNDGLNTVIPLGNDDYYRARPSLAVRKNAALRLTDDFAVHPSCAGFKKMYDAGDLAIVHATGYPNANRSHFTATDIRTTAEPEKKGTSGWLGRYCDACCAGTDPGKPVAKADQPALAIAMDSEPPPAVTGEKYVPLSFQANAGGGGGRRGPGGGGFAGGGQGMSGSMVSKLNGGDSSPGAMEGPGASAAHTEAFLQQTALNARLYADKIRNISGTIQNKATYPQTQLSRDLKLIAQLIASGMPTRVYYVKLGGFDTHADQLTRHPRLLEELTGGVAAFMDDLKQLGQHDRVTLMTFSEFGRRVHENGSGTDHGEAAPMFLAGGAVKAGFYGKFPSLAESNLHRGDVPFTTDFRRVYATMLHNWLGADDAKILGGNFEAMDILKKA